MEKRYFQNRAVNVEFIERKLKLWATTTESDSNMQLCRSQGYNGDKPCIYCVLKAFEDAEHYLRTKVGVERRRLGMGEATHSRTATYSVL